eukprot:3922733-Rhodomonas_salina.1
MPSGPQSTRATLEFGRPWRWQPRAAEIAACHLRWRERRELLRARKACVSSCCHPCSLRDARR